MATARRTRTSSKGLCAAFMMTPSQVDVATESTVTFAFFWKRSIDSSGKFQTRSTSPVSSAVTCAALSGMMRNVIASSLGVPGTK